jgi:hypothetical protein
MLLMMFVGVTVYANEYRSIGTIPKALNTQMIKQNVPETQVKSGKLKNGVFSTKEGSKTVHYLMPTKNKIKVFGTSFFDKSTVYSIQGKTYVPIGFAKQLGVNVFYDNKEKSTFIQHPKTDVACLNENDGKTVNVKQISNLKMIAINTVSSTKKNGKVVGVKRTGSNNYVQLSSLVKYLNGVIVNQNGSTYVLTKKERLFECVNTNYSQLSKVEIPSSDVVEQYLTNQTIGLFVNKDNIFSLSFKVEAGTYELSDEIGYYYREPHDFSIRTYCVILSKGNCKDNQEVLVKHLEKIFSSLDYKFPSTTFYGSTVTSDGLFYNLDLSDNDSLYNDDGTIQFGMYWQNYIYYDTNPYGFYKETFDDMDLFGIKKSFKWLIEGLYDKEVVSSVSAEYGMFDEFYFRFEEFVEG